MTHAWVVGAEAVEECAFVLGVETCAHHLAHAHTDLGADRHRRCVPEAAAPPAAGRCDAVRGEKTHHRCDATRAREQLTHVRRVMVHRRDELRRHPAGVAAGDEDTHHEQARTKHVLLLYCC